MGTISLGARLPGRRRARARLAKARELRKSAESIAAEAHAVYLAQAGVSEQLRDEVRRNHFADLFEFGIPTKEARE